MDEQIVKLIILVLVVVLPAIFKSAEEARKKRNALEPGKGPEPRVGGGRGADGGGGKSLADWIEELREEAADKGKRSAAPKQAPVARQVVEEEEAPHHQHHETLKPTSREPHETVRAQRETEHTFQQSIRPSVIIDENDDDVPVKRARRAGKDRDRDESKGPTRKRAEAEVQVARVAPRYESEHSEAVEDFDPKATKARRAQRARRASRSGSVGMGGGRIELSREAMRRAFIMKEVLDLPIALREQGRNES